MPSQPFCPFCSLDPKRVIGSSDLAVALRDGYPVSPGHTLIVPRRHVGSLRDVTTDEWLAIWLLLGHVRDALDKTLAPQGYNVGINDGPAAGQTVMHLHVHLIPRFEGDVPDARGGVRWVLPAKADYWSSGRGPDEA